MYEPAGRHVCSLAFLWPALVASTASEIAAQFAKQFTGLAVGDSEAPAAEPAWATPHRLALELKTVRLRDFSTDGKRRSSGRSPALLCAPFALHGAAVSDLAVGHSLVSALREAGLAHLYVTDWRSASADMRSLRIDDYLADLNVLVDEIGPPVDLIGLCQGGFMALIYAARFPTKVRKLVLAAAPIDIAAAASALSALAEASPLAVFHELVRLGDGLVPGRQVLKFWSPESLAAEDIRALLETDAALGSPAFSRLEAVFRSWYASTLDLPGAFFLEAVERLYKRNELAGGNFVALGKTIALATLTLPLFLLAARDDELVAPQQLFAVERLVGTAPRDLRKATAPCRHLGLFMGKNVLHNVWPGVVRWLAEPPTATADRVENQFLRAS
jgi:poly(3-hydroxyalkanoate) synthetase